MRIEALRIGLLSLCGLLFALSAGSCGKVQDNRPLFDSNTNWLVPCMADDQCTGSLRCYCGQCTKPCAQDVECSLLNNAECAESSEALCGEDRASAGGLCVRGCAGDAECGDDFSCVAGQCVPKPCSAGQCTALACGTGTGRNWDDILQDANNDLAVLDADDRGFQRYFVLGNESELSDPGTGICEASLERKRQALSKLLNSLSIDPNIEPPTPVDADRRLFRIDLRDYQWDREARVGTPGYADVWEALIANDPYAMPFLGEDADELVNATTTSVPVLLVDGFLATATDPALYYSILGLPARVDVLVNEDLLIPADAPASFQAGFIDDVELLARRWELGVRIGYLWIISDYGRPPGALFEDPLQEPLGERELIFTLPNGLQAFAFASADGRLQEGWSVSRDPRETDRVARAPRSNWRRHSRALAIRDQVRGYVAANEQLYEGSLSIIEERFAGAEALSLVLERDADQLTRRALQLAGLDPFEPEQPVQRPHDGAAAGRRRGRDAVSHRSAGLRLGSPRDSGRGGLRGRLGGADRVDALCRGAGRRRRR